MPVNVRKVAVAILVAAAVLIGSTAIAQTVQRFSDVPPDHPQAAAIAWAAETGLTAGYGDGTFRPEQPLSKQHAVIFVERFYDAILGADVSTEFTRGDMMTLLHTMAAPVSTTIPTAVGAWIYGAQHGDYGQEFPVAWVVSDSGRTQLIRECDWFPNHPTRTDWYWKFTDDDQTIWVSRLAIDQVEMIVSGLHSEVTFVVWNGQDELPPPDSPWQPVEFDPRLDVFETFQITNAREADAWVERRCQELGWS